MATEKQVNLADYTLDDLNRINQGMAQELQFLTTSLGNLKLVLNKYRQSEQSLTMLKTVEDSEREAMIPLTSALLVPGKVASVKQVRVDIGTGYFADLSIDDALKFFERRVDLLMKNIDVTQKAIIQKREELATIRREMQIKAQGLQAAQAAAMKKIDSIGMPSK